MRQPAYAKHLIYAPQRFSTTIRHRNASLPECTLRTGGGRPRYGERLEDNYILIDVMSTFSMGETLPLIVMSDVIHLSSFAGNKEEWPVYMKIGNLSSKMRQMPSKHSVVMVALLPIPIKNRNILRERLDEQ